jgi:hypothetical protein
MAWTNMPGNPFAHEKIRIDFCDFSHDFSQTNNFGLSCLRSGSMGICAASRIS